MLVRSDFYKAFILDVDWSTKGVVVILFQKDGMKECVIAYAFRELCISSILAQ
jgi:hypothetical protein